MQNLFGIAGVVFIIRKVKYFACLAGKCLFTSLLGCLGAELEDNLNFLHFYLSRNAITQN